MSKAVRKPFEFADEQQKELYKQFPKGHLLSDPQAVDNLLLWNTFFRRNPNRFAIDYLQINLYPYQEILLYEMGVRNVSVVIGSRNIAKTFIVALYACCYCLTHPNGEFLIAAATRDQANIVIDEKIARELCNISPVLSSEIDKFSHTNQATKCTFKNGSHIKVVTAGESARGNRSTRLLREEFRQMDAQTDSKILSPCQHPRQAPYLQKEPYSSAEVLPLIQEQPADIYISSSWIDTDDGEFIWHIVDGVLEQQVKGHNACFLAFDEALVLKHGLKTREQLQYERARSDEMSWQTEYLNLRVRENTDAFFTFEMLNQNRISRHPWYPRKNDDVLMKRKNPYDVPKQYGEIRLIASDLAFVAGAKNDRSAYVCMRLIPEVSEYKKDDGDVTEVRHGYRRVVPYIESHEGMETMEQAIRIRQLYEDFNADYIVCDVRSAGIAVVQNLSKVLYDAHRNIEYEPLCCMNDDRLAAYAQSPEANKCIYAMAASAKSNSEMALSLRRELMEHNIELLVPFTIAQTEILNHNRDYVGAIDGATQHFYEVPFIETQQLVTEMLKLEYSTTSVGDIQIREKASNRKDHFSALEYANAFANMKIKDLVSGGDHEYLCLVN